MAMIRAMVLLPTQTMRSEAKLDAAALRWAQFEWNPKMTGWLIDGIEESRRWNCVIESRDQIRSSAWLDSNVDTNSWS